MSAWQRDLGRGTALAAVSALGAWLLARFAFGRLYILGVLLPALLVAMLLLAWLIHLCSDGFFGRSRRKEEPAAEKPAGPYASFGDGVLKRAPAGPVLDSQDILRALLWAAAELAVLSALLYHGAGIGASWWR